MCRSKYDAVPCPQMQYIGYFGIIYLHAFSTLHCNPIFLYLNARINSSRFSPDPLKNVYIISCIFLFCACFLTVVLYGGVDRFLLNVQRVISV